MTLVLALSGPEFTIQLSDRKLTRQAGTMAMGPQLFVLHEKANKAGAIECGDARVAYGFCGLAGDDESDDRNLFDTRRWLRSALVEAAPPECQIEPLVERVAHIATEQFAQNSYIQRLSRRARRLSVMLTGYWNTTHGYIPACWF